MINKIFWLILCIFISYYLLTIRLINFKVLKYILKKKSSKDIYLDDKYYDIVKGGSFDFYTIINIIFNQKKYFNFEKLTELAHLNYILNSYSRPKKKENSKLYWYYFCKKYNFNHPIIYIVKQNNEILNFNNINYSDKYILKPLINNQGNGIIKINGTDISSILKKKDNIIIQQFLKDKYTIYMARHFRLITGFNGTVIALYEFVNNKDIISNLHNGGNIKNISHKYYNNKINYSHIENNLLNECIDKILNIHKKNMNDLVSIGWDLMFNNNNIYLLEGNVYGHGVIFNVSIKEDINRYYNIVNKFLLTKLNN